MKVGLYGKERYIVLLTKVALSCCASH